MRNQRLATCFKWLFGSVLLWALMATASANPFEGVNDDPSARLLFAMDPFEIPIAHSYSIGNAKEKVLSRFGEPLESSVSTYETRWVGETQTSYRLSYADVEFVIISFDDRPATWIESIKITGNTNDLKLGIHIGMPRAEIVSQFAPAAHYADADPMRVSIPTLETRGDIADLMREHDSYSPTIDITFEFDADDRLEGLSIFTVADL
jgi:hypothetical protein